MHFVFQARSVAEGILATVALMQDSRLPCFGRGAPIPNLRKRFHLDMTEAKAAAFIRSTILDAYDKVMSFAAVFFNGSDLPTSECACSPVEVTCSLLYIHPLLLNTDLAASIVPEGAAQ